MTNRLSTLKIVASILLMLTCQGAFAQLPGGAPFMGSSWANLTVGRDDNEVSYRFRATHSGTVTHFVFNLRHDNGAGAYSRGNGGQLRVRLVKDSGSNHVPSENPKDVIAEALLTNLLKGDAIKSHEFNIKYGALEAGKIYHLWFVNPLALSSRKANYVSVNTINNGGLNSNPVQPQFSDLDLATLYRDNVAKGGKWAFMKARTPFYAMRWHDGTVCGQGYMAAWTASGKQKILGQQAARQYYEHKGATASYSKMFFHITRVGSPSPLTVSIYNSSGTRLLAKTQSASAISTAYGRWSELKIPEKFTFQQGKKYYITFELNSNSGSGYYQAVPIQKMNSCLMGNACSNVLRSGFAQSRGTNGKWVNGWLRRGSVWRDADIPLYFKK